MEELREIEVVGSTYQGPDAVFSPKGYEDACEYLGSERYLR